MRKFIFGVLLMALLVMAGGIMAQDSATYCGDLSADDCAILEASAAAQAGLSSATADFTLDLGLSGIPDMPGDIALNLTGNANYAADPAALAALEGAAGDMTDPAAAMGLAGQALAALNAELNLTLNIPEELAAQGIPFSQLDLNLRLVDGVGYINFDTLAPLLAGTPQGEVLKGWGGLNLVEALEQMGPMLLGQMGEMPATGGDMGAVDMSAMEGVTITRDADADGAAVFVTTLDVAAVLKNPMVAEQIRSQMQSQNPEMTEEEFTAVLDVLTANPDSIKFSSTQWIDLETSFVRGASLDLTIDVAAIGAAAGEADASGLVTIAAQINYANQNSAPEVTAPEGAGVITMEQFFNFLFTGELTPAS